MSSLAELAAEVGLFPSYAATTGDWVTATDSDLLATLQCYGVDIERSADADAVLADWRRRRAGRVIEPVIVAWDGLLGEVAVGGEDRPGLIELEGGGGTVAVSVVGGRLEVGVRLPFGAHRLVLEPARAGAGPAIDGIATVVAAPTVAWRPRAGRERQWGVFAPTYALRTAHTRGIGDIADLGRVFEWLHRRGGQVVMTLPLLASYLDPPAAFSPYTPVSRRFWNECYADLSALTGTVVGAGAELLSEPGGPLVDYPRVWAERRAVLQGAADQFFAAGDGAGPAGDYQRWLAGHPLATEYARFRAAAARYGRNWRAWPARLPEGDPAEVRFHLFAQYLTDGQLAALRARLAPRGQLLALDLALGSNPDGFDVWRERHLFVDGVSVGAPPDSFFTLGQDWGFPPPHPEASRAEGHRYLRECIGHHLAHAGLLRIDHILGMLRLFWVRPDVGPAHGVYVRYPLEELLAVICLEAARHDAIIVGENLGTVPPEITEAMAQHGILGCAVSIFDLDATVHGGPLPVPAPLVVATTNTHDTATFAAYWRGADIDDRFDLGLLDDAAADGERHHRAEVRAAITDRLGLAASGHAYQADADPADKAEAAIERAALAGVVASVAESDAVLVLATMEDCWAEVGPQNVPGTVSERPNWQRRHAVAVEDWDGHPGVEVVIGAMRRARPGFSESDEREPAAPNR